MTAQVLDTALQNELGITCNHEVMPNGESRNRMNFQNGDVAGNAYILTSREHCDDGGWQNSHYHKWVLETYIVQKEWMASAILDFTGALMVTVHEAGDVFTTELGQDHNVYLPSGAVIHTVKHGKTDGGPDWHASPKLDALTKHLSETDIHDFEYS